MHRLHQARWGITILILFQAILLQGATDSLFNQHFYSKTLRFDYLHSGDHEQGEITFDKLVEEPYWGGSKVHLADSTGYGRYYFEVLDGITGNLLYSRGYSTLFVEWQDTEEAKTTRKTFKESLIMPFPRQQVNLKIYSRDKKNDLHLLYETDIDPEDELIKQQEIPAYQVKDIHITGSPEERLDIVILAEGYTEDELEQFSLDCTLFSGYLFGASPFRERQNSINLRGVMAVSEESGISIPGEGIEKKTILGASFYTFGSERYLMAEDFQRVRDIASLVPYDQIFILVNSDKYGGGGIFNFYATGTSKNKNADFLLIHEFGHSFGGLADEYYTSEVATESFYDLTVEPWEPNITTLTSFDQKWLDMLEEDIPIPTPVTKSNSNRVGVYEGGGYSSRGIYRPYIDCTMKSVRYDAFCPVCKRAINRMIDFYSEE